MILIMYYYVTKTPVVNFFVSKILDPAIVRSRFFDHFHICHVSPQLKAESTIVQNVRFGAISMWHTQKRKT